MRRPGPGPKVIIVGQAPSRSSDPAEPLSGRSGAKLADLCGIALPDFLARFERLNLLDAFPGKAGKGDVYVGVGEARVIAENVLAASAGRSVVVLGAVNAAAFRLTAPAFRFQRVGGASVAWCPHPSGVNRWWNDPANAARARRFWRRLARAPGP